MIEYKGYTGVFEFDPDLGLFAGHVVDLRDEIYFEGDSVVALRASMQRAVDHYLEVCGVRGDEPEKPFSGKLNVRLGSELHRSVAVAAAVSGESINSWIQRVVESAAQETVTTAVRPRKRSSKSRASPAKRARTRPKKQSA